MKKSQLPVAVEIHLQRALLLENQRYTLMYALVVILFHWQTEDC